MERDAILVLCTVPAEGDVGERLARGVVQARLAACVSVLGPVRSIYRWQDELHDGRETQLFIKSRRSRYAELERYLRDHHPYQEPEILAFDVAAGSASYLAWLAAQT